MLVRRNSTDGNRPNYSEDPDGFIPRFQKKSPILTHHIHQLISVPGDSASDRVQFSGDQPCVPGDLEHSSSLQEQDQDPHRGHNDHKNKAAVPFIKPAKYSSSASS